MIGYRDISAKPTFIFKSNDLAPSAYVLGATAGPVKTPYQIDASLCETFAKNLPNLDELQKQQNMRRDWILTKMRGEFLVKGVEFSSPPKDETKAREAFSNTIVDFCFGFHINRNLHSIRQALRNSGHSPVVPPAVPTRNQRGRD